MDRIAETIPALGIDGPIPGDAATTSGSGLDPDISPAYARAQVARVAAARPLPADQVAALVEASIEGPMLGVLGESRVNVLRLNLALDALPPSP
jgi:K+-transporting ATPase ATPase C chain